MNTPTITVASRARYPHVEGVFVDNVMIGWGPQSGALADELRERTDGIAAQIRDEAFAEDGINAERYCFGWGEPW